MILLFVCYKPVSRNLVKNIRNNSYSSLIKFDIYAADFNAMISAIFSTFGSFINNVWQLYLLLHHLPGFVGWCYCSLVWQ